jgi:HK97 family phage major capsid protein
MTIEEIISALQAIVDGSAERDLTDEEVTRYEELESQLAVARRSAEIRSRQDAYTTPTTTPVIVKATASDQESLDRSFETYLRTGAIDDAMTQFRAQSEGSVGAGGYLVPDGFRQMLVERMKAFGGLQAAATTITTTTGQDLDWPTVDDTSNEGEIVAEAGTFASGADMTFDHKTLGAYKYFAGGASNLPLKVSWELLQDSAFDIQAFLTRALGTRIARIQASHWVTGTGSSQPEGILQNKSAYDNIASNTTGPTFAELVATIHALDPAYRQGASWLMNDATLGTIRSITDDNSRPLWMSSSEAGMDRALPGGTLLGYPVVIDQAMPSIGDVAKFLAFGDLAQAYVVRRVKDITLVVLNELYAANGQVGFMAWARADGAVQDSNAYVVLAGQDT